MKSFHASPTLAAPLILAFILSLSAPGMTPATPLTGIDTEPATVGIISANPLIQLDGREGADLFPTINVDLRGGDFPAIIRRTKQILSQYPNLGLAYEILGTAYFYMGQMTDAVDSFQKATKLAPKQSGPWTKLGIIAMEANKLPEAERFLTNAIRINPDDRIAHQRLGMLYEYLNEYPKAIEHFRKGLKGTPTTYLGIATNLGRLLNQFERFGETIEILEARVPMNVSLPEAHLILGSAYLRTGRYPAALQRFERVLALQPDSDAALFGKSIALRETGRPAASRQILKELTKKRPDWIPAWLELGQTCLEMDDMKAARAAFRAAEKAGAASASVAQRLARYHLKKKDLDAAERILQENLKSAEAPPALFVDLAEIATAKGNGEKGLEILRKGIARFPDSAYLHFRLGSQLAALRHYQEGVAEFEEALRLSPDDPLVLKALSLALAKTGDTARSAHFAAKLHSLMPERPSATIFYATRLEADGQTKEAIRLYRKILAMDPENVVALNNLSMLLADEGKFTEAEELARNASRLRPEDGNLLDTLGWILYKQGQYAEATALLEKACQLMPDAAVIWYHRGLALEETKDHKGAKTAFAKAVELQPDAKWANEARKYLDTSR